MRYEQHPENPELADAEYAERWLRGEYQFMNQHEQEEYLLLYGTRKQRNAIPQAAAIRGACAVGRTWISVPSTSSSRTSTACCGPVCASSRAPSTWPVP